MNFLSDLYYKSLGKNEEGLWFWENYLQNLRALEFTEFTEKLKVPALIPVGSRVFFRGELKHTNEVTIALGADYFVKCSLKQAEVIKQHRIKVAESKLQELRKEREYVQSQLSFSTDNVFKEQGQDIFEEYAEEEDLKWREKHRENMRQFKQRSKSEKPAEEVTDEELWLRLEELELKEELEEEMANMDSPPQKHDFMHSENLVKTPEDISQEDVTAVVDNDNSNNDNSNNDNANNDNLTELTENKKQISNGISAPKNTSKLDLLEQVIEKQNEIKEKLNDLRNKKAPPSKTVKDLISKIDEMEQLEELEDEMDRLDDVLNNEDVEVSEVDEDDGSENSKTHSVKIKRSVSFADEDTSETIEITFCHSETEPDETPYNEQEGITKPSDIYAAFSNLFSETTSILKKSKYDRDLSPTGPRYEKRTKVDEFQEASENCLRNKTILINDIVEKVDENDNKYEGCVKRPMSLFKKRRQQNLS